MFTWIYLFFFLDYFHSRIM